MFIFHSLIAKTIHNKEKLFTAFIDYQKAFDSINRRLLWHKIIRDGVSETMVKALRAMYDNVNACVRFNGRYSDFLSSKKGVKQGDPLSPVLFIFFINDMLENVGPGDGSAVNVNDVNLCILLYADDAVIFAKSKQSLQNMMDNLKTYNDTWDLTLNTSKTNILVFEKGRHTQTDIYYNGAKLETVESFKYLGIMFYKNGNWNRTQKCLSQYGSYALYNLNNVFESITLPVKDKCKLFDSLVRSVLIYGSEVWGYHVANDVERIYTKFLRSILGVKKSTHCSFLYGELGRQPLSICRKLNMLRYWKQIRGTNDLLLRNVYTMLKTRRK